MIKRDPGINMKNPKPVDYLLPGDDSIRNYPPGGPAYGGGSGNYTLSSPTIAGVPSYNAPGWGSAPVYSPVGVAPVPKYDAPELSKAPEYNVKFRELPTYKAKAWDEGAIDALAQKRAAPGLRQLRQQVQRVTGRRFDNPQVGRMTLRDALQGYGSGVSSVMGSASEAAAGEYGQRYARESQNAQAEYASNAAAANAFNQYQSDVAKMNYQGSFAQWQAENQRTLDEAKTNYGGAMTKWGAENEANREAARLRHETSFEEWKAQNASNERMAERNHEAALMKWKADTEAAMRKSEQENAYKLKERSFEDAWERWKKQQKETSAGYTWRPNSQVIQRQVRGY